MEASRTNQGETRVRRAMSPRGPATTDAQSQAKVGLSRQRRAQLLGFLALLAVLLPSLALIALYGYQERKRAVAHGQELLERASASTWDTVMATEEALTSVAFVAREGCSERLISAFRFANAGETPLRRLGYVDPEGSLRCTTMGMLDPPLSPPIASFIGSEQHPLRFTLPIETVLVPGRSIVVAYELRDGAYVDALISPGSLLDYVTPFELRRGYHVAVVLDGWNLIEFGERPEAARTTLLRRELDLYGLAVEVRLDPDIALQDYLRNGAIMAGVSLVFGLGVAAGVGRLAGRRPSLGQELETALRHDRLEVHYQPIVALGGEGGWANCCGFEALVRWHHPEDGWIPPDVFVQEAERTGRIGMLTDWVVARALAETAPFLRADTSLHLAINIAPDWLEDRDNLVRLLHCVEREGVNSRQIVLEVTERGLVDSAECKARTREVSAQGISLAVDDFGTGYCSLAYIADFKLDILKIDRRFVAAMSSGGPTGRLVETIQQMATTLGLRTVAEGVEGEEQAEALTELGVTFAQGWHFARPMPAEALRAYLEQQAADREHREFEPA